MAKLYELSVQENVWKLTKPSKRKIFRDITILFILGFLFYAYMLTNGFKMKDPSIFLRNISLPFGVFLILWIYKWIVYKRNVDITIHRISVDKLEINGKSYTVDPSRDYVRVFPYSNRVGGALFKISLRVDGRKVFIARNLATHENAEIVQSISSFLNLKIVVHDDFF